MSERPLETVIQAESSSEHTSDCFEPAVDLAAAQDSPMDSLSCPPLPPLQSINPVVLIDPSPLTLPTTNLNSQNISIRRVEYDVTDAGVVLSMPVTTQIPNLGNSNNGTYHEGYDSDGELGPFFDAVANQKDDDDEDYDEHETLHAAGAEVSNEGIQEEMMETVPTNLPEFQAMTVAQLKEELRK
jgi:hypothetical protein